MHIPFCVKKCNYCDFLSAPATEYQKEQYVEMLCKEIRSYKKSVTEYELKTIYFGGGTPSVLSSRQMEQLLTAIKETFYAEFETAEITMEVNPGTVTRESLLAYRGLGINRLSIGVQSAHDEELALLGRIHTFAEAKQCYLWAREAGFENISLDVISALPKQTFSEYKETLEELIALNPEHISSYSLIIEEKTPFFDLYSEGKEKEGDLPGEDIDREMYAYTKKRLEEVGYERYEISNYAKPGYESKHNSSYWTGIPYIGAGLGASSLFTNARYHNESDLQSYLAAVEAGEDIRRDMERLVTSERMEEFMMLGLRMMKGVSRAEFQNRFGCAVETVYGQALKKLERNGLLTVEGDRIALTDLGIDVSNQVFVEFIPEDFVRR